MRRGVALATFYCVLGIWTVLVLVEGNGFANTRRIPVSDIVSHTIRRPIFE
jgi:hypothetical protein